VVELEDGKFKRKITQIDLTGMDALLFHKNVFIYKFSNPKVKNQEITATDYHVLTHIQRFPTNRTTVLDRFCLGFKWLKHKPENKEPDWDKVTIPEGWDLRILTNVEVKINQDLSFEYRDSQGKDIKLYKAGEDWANNENGLPGLKNWFNFPQRYKNSIYRDIPMTWLVTDTLIVVLKKLA